MVLELKMAFQCHTNEQPMSTRTKSINVWFQKISIPPPRKTIGNSEGEGGLKGSNFQGVGGFRGKLLFQRVTNHIQNIESNIRSI